MKQVVISKSLKEDALSVCNSIYRLNASSAIGYLFNPTVDGDKVYAGMFCHNINEMNQWTFFIDFKNYNVFEI